MSMWYKKKRDKLRKQLGIVRKTEPEETAEQPEIEAVKKNEKGTSRASKVGNSAD